MRRGALVLVCGPVMAVLAAGAVAPVGADGRLFPQRTERRHRREEAELLARAGEAKFRLALLRRHREAGSGGPELADAIRSLEEARELDPANLRALAFLGLARLEAARPGPANPGPLDFAPVREPLEELFRLSQGWADPGTRTVLEDVSKRLDDALRQTPGDPPPERLLAAIWWGSWRERVAATTESKPPAAEVVALVEDLRSAPFAWVRERAAERLAGMGVGRPEAAEPLAEALREDESPWVRAAAARAVGGLRAGGWDLLLADSLKNDPSAWVRRTAAEALRVTPRRQGEQKGAGESWRPGVLAVQALKSAVLNDTPRVAAAAALSLGGGTFDKLSAAVLSTSKGGGGEKELIGALESSSALVREAAVLGLGRPDSERAKARLRPLLRDGDDRVRFAAVHSLLLTGDPTALDELKRLAWSSVPLEGRDTFYPGRRTVGEAARQLLETLEKTEP